MRTLTRSPFLPSSATSLPRASCFLWARVKDHASGRMFSVHDAREHVDGTLTLVLVGERRPLEGPPVVLTPRLSRIDARRAIDGGGERVWLHDAWIEGGAS